MEAKRDTKKRLKIPRIISDATLYFPVLWFIRHFIATWNGTPRDKKTLLWNPSLALGFWHYTSRQREGHQNEPFFPLWIPKWPASVYSQQCQHIINRKGNENYWNDQLRENFMIICQILSTNSLSKCIEISLENSNRNSGTQILLKSPIPWDWHLSLNTYNSINNSNII